MVEFVTTPNGRISFYGKDRSPIRSLIDEPIYYPDEMKWSFNLPLLWRGKSDFEQVYRDLTAIRRFRAFLRSVAAPVYDLWTSAAYPVGVPEVPFERRLWIDHFNGVDPRLNDYQRDMIRYFTEDVRLSTYSLRRTLNETYGKYGR